MSAQQLAPKRAEGSETGQEPVAVNEVRLVGRVAADPELRELPSGDTVWWLRVIVDRPPEAFRGTSRVDSVECAVWKGRAKRSVPSWRPGDVVEVTGALRRRFFRVGGAVASRVEVEVTSGRVIRRAATG